MNSDALSLPLIDSLTDERTLQLGNLTVKVAEKPVSLPLKRVAIAARVAERIAEVTIEQTFRNTYAEHLEAVYTFPMSGRAAVGRFEMKIGSRTIRGFVKERGEARRQYREALDQGKRTALLEQERDDVFTVQVGNLPPGEEVIVLLTYSESLSFLDTGSLELRLPLVVAPRYIPGRPLDREDVGDGVEIDTNVVPDASRITPPRLVPGFDPKVALSIEVDLLAVPGVLTDLCCSQHAIRTIHGKTGMRISLSHDDELLDRDFVLRWRATDQSIQCSFLVHREEGGAGYGMLSVMPPAQSGSRRQFRDIIFVLDRSGSMGGVKMVSAARACSILLRSLNPQDRFCILAFDDRIEWFPGEKSFLIADEGGIGKGEIFLHKLEARGGTEMDAALAGALLAIDSRTGRDGRLPILTLITDGQIGDESRILKRVQAEIGPTRVFTVGVDTAVNQSFLRRLAELGHGTSNFVEPGVQLEDTLRQVARETGEPLVMDLTVEGPGIDRNTLTPEAVSDLFAGRPVTVYFQTKSNDDVRVAGRRREGGMFELTIPAVEVELPVLAHLWARSRVMDLEDSYRILPGEQGALKKQIVELAVKHSLLTRFTAFVVVDEEEVVNADGSRRKVVQPVSMPARWEMESVYHVGGMAAPSAMACMSLEEPEVMITPDAHRQFAGPRTGSMRLGEELLRKVRKLRSNKKNEKIARLWNDFSKKLADAIRELKAGRRPAWDEIERLRRRLLKEAEAAGLSSLQRFLVTQTVNVIARLRDPKTSVPALQAVLETHLREFEQLKKETLSHPGLETDRFWESGI